MDAPALATDAPQAPAKRSPSEIVAGWLRALIQPGQVFEIRALGCRTGDYQRPHNRGGFFDFGHIDTAAEMALSLTSHAAAEGVYLTLNPTAPALLARRSNRIDVLRKEDRTTSDGDIVQRLWLLIDLDPKRPAGVSSTDAEKQAAWETAEAIREWLTTRGWPAPIVADSGNGWHLLYRVDLPTNDSGVVKRVLHALAAKFDSPAATVDRSVFNPARIVKLYGTISRKGDSTPDRPHRRSFVKSISDELIVVPAGLLQSLADEAPAESRRNGSSRAAHRGGASNASLDWKLKRTAAYANGYPPSIAGQHGHDVAFRLFCNLIRGFDLSVEQAISVAAGWNQTCLPPWSDSELLHKAKEAEAKAEGEPGYLLNATNGSPETNGHNPYADVKLNGFESDEPKSTAQTDGQPIEQLSPDEAGLLDPQCEQGRTDHANAVRFAHKFRQSVRYCHPWGRWLVWDGKRWEPDNRDAVMQLAKTIPNDLWLIGYTCKSDQAAKPILKHAAGTASARSLKAMLSLATSELGIPVLPQELDADPWLFNCPNGTVDLRTGELRPHRQADRITKLCPTAYDPTADTTTLRQFLGSLFPDDPEHVDFLQRLVGHSLTGVTTEQNLPILWGSGSNGKSTLVDTFCNVIGPDYFIEGARDLLIEKPGNEHPTQLADLHGKRLVICSETDDGRRLAEGLVKKLTGGDKIKARRMREDFWEFTPTHKLWLMTNHKPNVRGTDHAIWRRLILIPFTRTFWNPDAGETGPEELRRDNTLKDRLAEEAQGILAWAVQGCLRWQWEGLNIPASIRAATESYRSDQDTVGQFITDCCITGIGERSKAKVIFAAYERWCDENGHRPLGQRKFGEIIGERFERFTYNGTWYRGVDVRESEKGGEHPEYANVEFAP